MSLSVNALNIAATTSTFAGRRLSSEKPRNSVRLNLSRQRVHVQSALFSKSTPKAQKEAPVLAAQRFSLSIPGALLQSRKNLDIPVELGFTKGNELFVGRLAMLGFAAALFGEVLTGNGALAQFDIETGLPLTDTEPLIIGLILFNLFVAFGGALGLSSGTFVPKDGQEATTSKWDARKSLARPREFFGITEFGFTKENELFVGRLAQLGFAASLVGEAATGLGPLAQFGLETGIPLNETEPLLLAFIALFATFAINEGTGKFEDKV